MPPDQATIKGFTITSSLRKSTEAFLSDSSDDSDRATIEPTKNLGKLLGDNSFQRYTNFKHSI